jgi:PIN domain nuclease of toxin-antitoxin system
MTYILDTHTLIWFLNGDKELSAKARKAVESADAVNLVSIASLWEMAIKISLDRLALKIKFEDLADEIEKNGFQLLPISFSDIVILSSLPFHHGDPFDRLIISQGINFDFTIISKDEYFGQYNVKTLW